MTESVWNLIYANNSWNGVDSLSGPGSDFLPTQYVARDLKDVIDRIGAKTVLDVGCGDAFWIPELPGYVGVDPSYMACDRALINHPDRDFRVLDPVVEELPQADAAICRLVIQHLNLSNGMAVIENIRRHCKWLIGSTNTDGYNFVLTTDFTANAYSPNMEVAPFNLGVPIEYILDGYYVDRDDERSERDPGKYLGVWQL
jgi:SAM-dependent methyltransferase